MKAADAIYKKVESATHSTIEPASLARLSDLELRGCGLSNSKVKTIRGLVDASISGRIKFEELHEIEDDAENAQQLTALWGIGQWTVDMFMMHQLGRLDVWPVGDLGVRKGWQRIYAYPRPLNKKLWRTREATSSRIEVLSLGIAGRRSTEDLEMLRIWAFVASSRCNYCLP